MRRFFYVIMKELIKQFLPPLAVKILRRLRDGSVGCIELPGWPDSGMDYGNKEIAQLVAAKTACRVAHKLAELTLSEQQSVAAAAVSAAAVAERPLRVIDLGGGCGMHFFQVLNALPGVELDWRIVELPDMAKLALSHPMLKFYSDLDHALADGPPALLHTSCALGFIRESDELLEKIFHSAAEYILLSRLAVTTGSEDIFALHRHWLSSNGPGDFLPSGFKDKLISYPVRIFPESRLEERFKTDYKIIWKSADPTAELNLPGREIAGRSWFLRRRK